MAKKPKTQGIEWLTHSLNAFNGSGYADRTSGGAFLDSYRDYKLWKRLFSAVVLLDKYWQVVLPLADWLVENSEITKIPSQTSWEKFKDYRKH